MCVFVFRPVFKILGNNSNIDEFSESSRLSSSIFFSQFKNVPASVQELKTNHPGTCWIFQEARKGHSVSYWERIHPWHASRSGPLPAAEKGAKQADDWRISWQSTEAVQQRCLRVSIATGMIKKNNKKYCYYWQQHDPKHT